VGIWSFLNDSATMNANQITETHYLIKTTKTINCRCLTCARQPVLATSAKLGCVLVSNDATSLYLSRDGYLCMWQTMYKSIQGKRLFKSNLSPLSDGSYDKDKGPNCLQIVSLEVSNFYFFM